MRAIMEFHIQLREELISGMKGPAGAATIIPFTGWVDAPLFSGRILPGAADVQTTDASGTCHMCAQYMFEGKDFTGADCRLFVRNDGYFEPGREPAPFHTCPKFLTDSLPLGEYLHQSRFRGEGIMDKKGLRIVIYDVLDGPEQKTDAAKNAASALEERNQPSRASSSSLGR